MPRSKRPKGTFPPPPDGVELRPDADMIWQKNPFGLPRIIFTLAVLRLGLGTSTRDIASYLFGIDKGAPGMKSIEQWVGWVTRAAVKEMRSFNYSQIISCDLLIKALWAESVSPRDLTKPKDPRQMRWWVGVLEKCKFPLLISLAGYVQLPSGEEDTQDVLELALRTIESDNKQRQQQAGLPQVCPRCTMAVNGRVRKGWMERVRGGANWYAVCINCGCQQFPPSNKTVSTLEIST